MVTLKRDTPPVRSMSVSRTSACGIFAIGDDAAVLDFSDQFLHRDMVEAHHRETIKGQVFDERAEGFLDGVEGLEVIEMLGVDIGDHRDIGWKLEEGAVALVGLDHHPLAFAKAGVGAIGVDDAAVDDRGVERARVEQGRHQRGRRRLAMRAGDRDALLEPHEFGQHFGAAHHRQASFARRREFGIVALDRGRDHDDRRLAEVFGVMAEKISAPFSRRRLTLALSEASEPCTS